MALLGLHVIWQAWLVIAAPYPAHYDFDEGVYATTAAAAEAGNRLYATVFLSQPPLLIGILAHVFGIFGPSLASARGTVVGFSVVWLMGLAAISGGHGRPRAAVWAVAIAGSATAFIGAAHSVQMEGPSEALAALAVALGLRAARGRGGASTGGWLDRMRWTVTGLAAGLAVMAKFTALISLVPLALIITTTEAGTASTGRKTARAVSAAAGIVLAALATIVWTGVPPATMWHQTVAFHDAVARSTGAPDPGRTARLLSDFAAANWFLAALGLAGAAYAARAWRGIPVAHRAGLAWLAADLAAVFLWRPVWPHHLAVFVSPLAILGAATAEAAAGALMTATARAPLLRMTAAAVVVCWVAALAGAAVGSVPQTSPALRAAATMIGRTVPSGAWIVADDPLAPFLAGRAVPPELCDTSEVRMRAGWLTAQDLTAAIGNPRVRGIVLWRGTFRERFPEFVGVAAKEFPRRWSAGNGREILAR